MRRVLSVALLVLGLSACEGTIGAGRRTDGGLAPPLDAASAERDAAVELDAAEPPPPDAALAVDAALDGSDGDADASPPDAGPTDPDAGSDAGPSGYQPDSVTLAQNLPAVVPVLRFSLGGQTIEKDVELTGTLEVFEEHAEALDDLDSRTPSLMAAVGFQGRGNFTWTLPKKGYAFELQDGQGAGLDLPMLGLPAGSDFALYACYSDKTCLRNALAFALGQALGRWSPRTRFVEVFIDDQYQGLYMLLERIRRDETRMLLTKPAEMSGAGDLTGDYVIRLEGGGKGVEVEDGMSYPRDFTTSSERSYTYHYPDAQKIGAEQASYIQGRLQAFEDAMLTLPLPHAAWVDLESWADQGIVQELTNNWDGYVHSMYLVKRADAAGGRFEMGPLWDFDLAFANGNVSGYNCHTDNWAYQNVRPAPDDVPPYWPALYANPDFQTTWKCRYQRLRSGALAMQRIDAQIAAWVSWTASARVRDQAKWQTVGMQIFPNCSSAADYAGEIELLRTWIAARLAWLDAQALAMPGTCE